MFSDDIDEGYVRAYDVADDGSLSNPRKFADGLEPDGIKVDVQGNLWCTSGFQVVVFRPDGSLLVPSHSLRKRLTWPLVVPTLAPSW